MAPERVVHISADYPDPINDSKTTVIRDLVGLVSDEFSNEVYSLNRETPQLAALLKALARSPVQPCLEISSEPFSGGHAVRYAAPPKGILHASMLKALGSWLAEQLQRGPVPDLLIGHKLTIEGIAVRRAASLLGIPYGISIQGNTDEKILRARADLRPELRRVYHDAAVVFPFTPWAMQAAEGRLGARTGPTFLLPCPTQLDRLLAPRPAGEGLISVFHLRGHHTKNLSGLAAAKRILERQDKSIDLTVVGGGSELELQRCKTIVGKGAAIKFSGNVAREDMQSVMNKAIALVLPSRRESFGLVFIEALFAGLPIIYPAGAGVDGYFDDMPFALRVDARDPAAIADAMLQAVRREAEMKDALRDWQVSDAARFFTRPAIARRFAAGIRAGLA